METARTPSTSKWQPSPAAFEKLLACLHPERNEAGVAYETLHQKLILYFQCRTVTTAEECADEVLNRVMRKLDGGEEIRDPTTYVFGIARMLRLEVARQQERRQEMPAEIPVTSPRYDEEAELTAQLVCLRQCLQKLSPANRALITEYYQDEEKAKVARQALAARLGLDMNALRVRACRVRDQLQTCVKKCVSGGKNFL